MNYQVFEGYTTGAQVGLYGHKSIMTEGMVGWTIHCLLDYDVS